MTVKLKSARHVQDYKIRLGFEDGVRGIVDFGNELWGEVFEPLNDVNAFRNFKLNRDLNTLTWPTGADFAPEFLYDMAKVFSKSQIDKLGERLRKGAISEHDATLLHEYRKTFRPPYSAVMRMIQERLPTQEVSGRPEKSTSSIVEKLRRESIRLTQMQDIAGCRLVVPTIADQDFAVHELNVSLTHTKVIDRRQNPSHGYRAIHIISQIEGKPVEIQVRTRRQHVWAKWVEVCADILDPSLKYGGGDVKIQNLLIEASAYVAAIDGNIKTIMEFQDSAGLHEVKSKTPEQPQKAIDSQFSCYLNECHKLEEKLEAIRQTLEQEIKNKIKL